MKEPTEFDWNSSATAVLEVPQPQLAPAPAEPPRLARYESLDVWRGAACLMLVLYHATFYAEHSWRSGDPSTWTPGGLAINLLGRMWIGVPIFFVVSGYCIAASSDSARRRGHSLRTYFTRRFRRIYPPLWAASALCVAVVLAASLSPAIHEGCLQLPKLAEFTLGNWFGNLTATEMWRPNVTGGEAHYLMKNTWTLCYEEQFYAVVGLLLLAPRRFFSVAAAVAAATLVARHVARASDVSLAGFFCDGHWLMFAMGILAYYRLRYARRSLRWIAAAVLALAGVYAVVDYRLSTTAFDKHLDEYLLVAALFGLALVRLYKHDRWLMGRRWLKPLLWYGKISYSVYLTHFPVVVILGCVLSQVGTTADWFVAAVTVPLCVAISVPLGYAFHMAVERHFMNAPLAARGT